MQQMAQESVSEIIFKRQVDVQWWHCKLDPHEEFFNSVFMGETFSPSTCTTSWWRCKMMA